MSLSSLNSIDTVFIPTAITFSLMSSFLMTPTSSFFSCYFSSYFSCFLFIVATYLRNPTVMRQSILLSSFNLFCPYKLSSTKRIPLEPFPPVVTCLGQLHAWGGTEADGICTAVKTTPTDVPCQDLWHSPLSIEYCR